MTDWIETVGGELAGFAVAPLKIQATAAHRLMIQHECQRGTPEGRRFLRGMLSEIQKGLPGVVVSRNELPS